jgi:hypothetical protein
MRGRWILALLTLVLAPIAWCQMSATGTRMGSGFVVHGRGMSRGSVFTGSSHVGIHFRSGFRRQFFFSRGFSHRRFLFAAVPWYYGYPGYYANYSDAPEPYGSYERSLAYYQQQRDLVAELDRLGDEIERLREDRQARYPAPSVPTTAAPEKSQPREPTTLVFQDKHTQEIHNYAIVGQTLWIFSEQRAHKVPLSSLDIEATRKTNEERGVEFRVPE